MSPGPGAEDLSPDALADILPSRPIRSYPFLLSTGADAMAWARAGAPEGAIVVADYQVSPRGRGGLEWTVRAGESLCFSMVLRPKLTPEREGWLYTVGGLGMSDLVGEGATIEWPDEVRREGRTVARVGVHAELGPASVEWAVLSVLLPGALPPRGHLLARAVSSIEGRYGASEDESLREYIERCETLGRRVTARLIPLGPTGPRVGGLATGAKLDGAIVIETAPGTHVAVRPQSLGVLEDEQPAAQSVPESLASLLRRQRTDPSSA